jgi:8-oxo-dGTP diphosphatase
MESGKDFIGVGCGAIIIKDNNEVLLVRRSKDARLEPGMWSRPGGMVEFAEPTVKAVEREVLEETGLKIRVVRPLEFTEILSPDRKKHWIALGYLARHVSGEPVNMEPDKHDEIRWFRLDRLPDNLTSYTRNAIDVYLRSRVKNE